MTVSSGRPSAPVVHLRDGLPAADEGGPFEHAAYLQASAEHEGTEPVLVESGGGRLALLTGAGTLHTVYGYPQPLGVVTDVADALVAIDVPLRVALSPLGAGAELAEALRGRLPLVDERAICVTDLDSDPTDVFDPAARSMVRRALRDGSSVEISAVRRDFGPLYRGAMEAMGAADLYRFSDAYVAGMGQAGAFQVTVSDPGGVAAAALFLTRGHEATYHLSARRGEPRPVPGAANLVLLEGLRECARRGAEACILGGGRSGDPTDALLRFKSGMSTRTLTRPTFSTDG
jgi:hypothetical protein